MALCFEAKESQFRREHDERMALAWHIAGLSRLQKIPSLKSLFAATAESRRPQTADEQWAIFSAMAARSRMN